MFRAGRLLTIKLIITFLSPIPRLSCTLLQPITALKNTSNYLHTPTDFHSLSILDTAKGCTVALWLALSLQNTPWLGRRIEFPRFPQPGVGLLRLSCTNYRDMPAFPYTEVPLRRPSWLNRHSAGQTAGAIHKPRVKSTACS